MPRRISLPATWSQGRASLSAGDSCYGKPILSDQKLDGERAMAVHGEEASTATASN